jgi:hypothetical protein
MTGAARAVVERTRQVETAEAAQVYRMVCRRSFYEQSTLLASDLSAKAIAFSKKVIATASFVHP